MNTKFIKFVIINLVLCILISSIYLLSKISLSGKDKNLENLDYVLLFSKSNIKNCLIEKSIIQQHSNKVNVINVNVNEHRAFVDKFSSIIRKHKIIIEPNIVVQLYFMYKITINTDENSWIFKFGQTLDKKGIIHYQICNDKNKYGIIKLDNQGTKMVLLMINEALSNKLNDEKINMKKK